MSLSIMAPDGEIQVPTPSGGGVNLELLTRISLLEQRLAEVEKHATTDTYGIVRLSGSESVTNSNGLALPASEKNALIEGTLANQISQVKQYVGNIVFGSIVLFPNSDTITINATGIIDGTAFAINGNVNAVSGVHVVGVFVERDTLTIALSQFVNSITRINYIYQKS